MPKTWIVELVAFSGAHQEQERWVRQRTAHVTRSDGHERQWGCRPYQCGPDPDDYYEGRSLSENQFERLYAFCLRLARRRDFACWSVYHPPAWHNGNYAYRELRIVRLRLPGGQTVRASLENLTSYDLPAAQRRKLEALLAPDSPEARLYRLYREARALVEAVALSPAARSRSWDFAIHLREREIRRRIAFRRLVSP